MSSDAFKDASVSQVKDPMGDSRAAMEVRVMLLDPSGNEALLSSRLLLDADFSVGVCTNLEELTEAVQQGCGPVIIAEEAMTLPDCLPFLQAVESQPSWSDLPVTILTSGDEAVQRRLRRLSTTGQANLALLQRPFHPESLLSTVEVACRARRRQYQVRDLLELQRANEMRLQSVLESISDAFVALDREWRFIYLNASFLHLVAPLFSSRERILGKSIWEIFPDIKDTDIGRACVQAMAEQKPGVVETLYQPLKVWIEIHLHPSPENLSIYIRDVTDRRRIEETRKALTRRLEAQSRIFDITLTNIKDFAYIFDRRGRFLYANKPLLDLWGLSLEEAVGKNFHDLHYPEDLAEQLQRQIREVVVDKTLVRGETAYTSPQGDEGYYEYIFTPVLATDGHVEAVVGSTRTITERKRTEKVLRAAQARVEATLLAADIGIWIWTPQENRFRGDKNLARLIYLEPAAEFDETLDILLNAAHPEDRARLENALQASSEDGNGELEIDYRVVGRGTSLRWVTVRGRVLHDHTRGAVEFPGVLIDITERKASEAALKEAKDAAEMANQQKDRFLAMLSHELRTPLTPVLLVSAAREADMSLAADIRADLGMIRRNVELETKLIDDLLDLSRITTGKLALRMESVDLNELVRQVCEICRPQISEKSLHLKTSLDPSTGLIQADSARLQQVLWNIIKNAVKFTPKLGCIHVSTRLVDEGRVEISVEDNGIGIAPEIMPEIFEAFEQGHAGITKQFGGLGLGLTISRALVGLHRGTIHATSPGPGKGSTFTILLPVGNEKSEPARLLPVLEDGQPPKRLSLLVVEDHVDTARTLANLLRRRGFEVTIAGDVAEALALAGEKYFDVLISDIGLPDGTGFDLMMQISELYGTPGIAMSGFGMDDDLRRSREAGFYEHLVKPVRVSQLEEAIRRGVQRG